MDANAMEILEKLYRDHFNNLVKIAYSLLKDYHRAEDIVQDTFISAEQHIEKLIESPNPAGWLTNKLKNKLKHEMRSMMRFRLLLEKIGLDRSQAQSGVGNIEFTKDIITEDEYRLLELVYVKGYTIKEAAEIVGEPYSTCRKRVQRAKDKIREKFDGKSI